MSTKKKFLRRAIRRTRKKVVPLPAKGISGYLSLRSRAIPLTHPPLSGLKPKTLRAYQEYVTEIYPGTEGDRK